MNLSTYIDHTILKATATVQDIKNLCEEAKTYNFYAVCVNGAYVTLAVNELKETDIKVAAVIGFPLGANTTASKVFEAQDAIENGATEIDMVINIGFLKSGEIQAITDEIKALKKAIGHHTLKVILENCYLTDQEKRIASNAALEAGADFIKTSTGFGTGGATPEDIALMKSEVKDALQIKASGGIRDTDTANSYISLGVSRIGTSSGISIVKNS